MQITAQLNNLRISPRKVRLVARAIKGMDAISAKFQLDYIIKKSSKPISKLLDSAMANAHNGFGLVKENMFIKDVIVNEGSKLKRFRPKGFGMASPIEKKTSHIKIVLEEKVPGLKAKSQIIPKSETAEITETTKEVNMPTKSKPEIKKELGKKGGIFGQVGKIKKFFRRKAI
ncbi:MAG: 50S ribosomal protein L22 [Candidatus Yanofskybacteria bacterium]|nr:50S ribosomal protein L22 [Candidatus Yanofskybacteria bacterium]